jgi:hypothetical protein
MSIRIKTPVTRVLVALASLRLTVALFVLSLGLVFFGTLAQMNAGIWTVVSGYFRSFLVWVPLQLFVQFGQVFYAVPRTWHVPGAFPFPGGWLLGTALLLNLVAAHAVRFKLSGRRAGILLIHSGLIVMMLGELVTGLFAIEGNMVIDEGKSSNYVEHTRYVELAVTRPSQTDTGHDEVAVVPGALLRQGRTVSHDDLPFDIVPLQFMTNSALRQATGERDARPAMKGAGRQYVAVQKREVSGVDTEQKVDTPSCYLELRSRDGNPLGAYLFSLLLEPQPIAMDGKTYLVALRWKRTYKPYRIHLIKFSFDRYMGTGTAKNYSSLVRVEDPERGESRQVLIRMNQPLRYRGDALYQHSFKASETTTILQVVQNPGWLMPYLSCAVVALGMFVHFGIGLNSFLRRRQTP